jgi:protein-L-isoaspartate(D-aspartate) O-methyltransferase
MDNLSSNQSAFAVARERMVREQLSGVAPHILAVMGRVPRHELVPEDNRSLAYADMPLPIGYGQTISQPHIVAVMTEQLDLKPAGRVLEIGTGSGYQAAVLAELVAEVCTIEIITPLALRAAADLQRLGYDNVQVRNADGHAGWPEAAPFAAVIVTCAPDQVPQSLIEQLGDGGRMVIPVGGIGEQELVVLRKQGDKLERRVVFPVRFVPMTGDAQH